MELYQEIDRKRAERYARRMKRRIREERRQRILSPIKIVVQVILGTALLYLCLFAGAIWASM